MSSNHLVVIRLRGYHDDDEESSYNTLVKECGSQEETIVEEGIGHAAPAPLTYLFTAHAYKNGDLNDAETVKQAKKKFGLNTFNTSNNHDDEFYPPEANQWRKYTQMEKCNEVMKTQEESEIKWLVSS